MPLITHNGKLLIAGGKLITNKDCCPDSCRGGTTPTGACCVGETCSIRTAAACAAMSGRYKGDGTPCSPNPCITPVFACCFGDNHCEELNQADCIAAGGSWKANHHCDEACFYCGTLTAITFSGVNLPGCCIAFEGSSVKYLDCAAGFGCVALNGTHGFSLGHIVGLGYRVADLYSYDGEECAGDAGGPNPDNELTIRVGCNVGEYPGLPLGWFIQAWGVRPIFSAYGGTDPRTPMVNSLTCGAIDPYMPFPFDTLEAVGDGGTAVLS